MKYVLVKDLPFAKAGIEAFVDFEDDVYVRETPITKCGQAERFWIGGRQDLLNRGWIKQVEPREFYLLDNKQIGDRTFYHDMEEAKKDVADWAIEYLIKVREVL